MMQARLLGNPKALRVRGLGTLEANILGDHLVRHIAAGRHEVATRPQVPTPERVAQLSAIHQEVMGGLPFTACITRLGASCGGTSSNRCTWSGQTWPWTISISFARQISRVTSRTSIAS